MRFLDQAKVYVSSGAGGNGAVSFRREKFIEFGGPNGGDGGKGGDVIAECVANLNTLLDYRYQQHFKAKKGGNGMGQNRSGAGGADVVLKLPPGTQIFEEDGEKYGVSLPTHSPPSMNSIRTSASVMVLARPSMRTTWPASGSVAEMRHVCTKALSVIREMTGVAIWTRPEKLASSAKRASPRIGVLKRTSKLPGASSLRSRYAGRTSWPKAWAAGSRQPQKIRN